MKIQLRFIALMVLVASQLAVCAQKEENPKLTAQKDYMFHKQFDGGIKIASTGLNFYLQYGILKNIYVTHLFTLEYEWHIDYRDKKTKADPIDGNAGRNYYFGVQNRFHVIRGSYGFEKALADKAAKKGVRLSWVGFFGPALGLAKPYYLDLNYYPDGNVNDLPVTLSQKYSSSNASTFLNQSLINQASPIWRGMNQISPILGGFGRTGLNFDFGSRDAVVKSIEAGVSLDVFYKKVPIYVNDDSNHFMFLGFYLAFQLGKRW